MGQDGHDHTISGLLRKRDELMVDAQKLREQLAVVGNTIESVDYVLRALGCDGELAGGSTRSGRVVLFVRNELRRFLIDELRKADGKPVSARDMAEKIITLEGKDLKDRRLLNDMVKRVGKSFKLLRHQGVAISAGRHSQLAWRLAH